MWGEEIKEFNFGFQKQKTKETKEEMKGKKGKKGKTILAHIFQNPLSNKARKSSNIL